MKKFFIVFFIIITLIFSGCGAQLNVEREEIANEKSMFVLVENGNSFYIVYHQDTKVMYAISNGYYNSGNFCLLVNPDGTPMLWEGSGSNG